MNADEHQRERMRYWSRAFFDGAELPEVSAGYADTCLAEFDKRFPAPAAVEPEPRIKIEWPACGDAELASLRTKARYWDAVASGKVRLQNQFDDTWTADYGPYLTARYPTPEEAVEAAIAAGALK